MFSFAIVIPNLNQSHFLPYALESIRYQNAPLNLAIMDGGSSDCFREVVGNYSDMISFLRSGPDKGQAAAIREGFDKVDGDIVAWLNADDYYFPGVLDKVASCFEENPQLDVIYGDAVHVSSEGFFLSYFPTIQEFNAKDLTRSCFVCQPACFVRRSAYEAVGGIDPTLQYTMDWDLWCRLSSAGAEFKYIRNIMATVRYYPGTKTLSGDRRRYFEIWRIERKYGHRLLPSSWLGSYFYDLTFKTRKTVPEKIAFSILNLLRRLKKRLFEIKDLRDESKRTIYGFHRGEPVVERCCMIHLPWYDKRKWKRLRLRVEPGDTTYRVTINESCSKVLIAKRGRLCVGVDHLDGPYRKISIECLSIQKWKLLDFSCELV